MTSSITVDMLATLKAEAGTAVRRRQHLNLHRSYTDPCQRFLNALSHDSYIRPHRHLLDPKDELLVAISGAFALCVFDDGGALLKVTPFATEAFWQDGMSFAVQVSPTTWHTVIALTDQAVLLEAKAGPYEPSAAKEPAPWAPDEADTDLVGPYLEMLRAMVLSSDGTPIMTPYQLSWRGCTDNDSR